MARTKATRTVQIDTLEVDVRRLAESCTCEIQTLEQTDAWGRLTSATRRLVAIGELLRTYTGEEPLESFPGERFKHLNYPNRFEGLGEIVLSVAAELAWLADRVE